MSTPRLLDLFSGAGGAARGYQLAGFHVTGVDNRPQPRYAGDAFVLGDALEFCAEHGREFDAIHASPPCQASSATRSLPHTRASRGVAPCLIVPLREVLRQTGRPYVIENVVGSPLLNPIRLCGLTFGLKVLRHRLFESAIALSAPVHPSHRGIRIGIGGYVCVAGHGDGGSGGWPRADGTANPRFRVPADHRSVASWRRAMEIDWMTRDGLAQAIPPAYTLFVGRQLWEVL